MLGLLNIEKEYNTSLKSLSGSFELSLFKPEKTEGHKSDGIYNRPRVVKFILSLHVMKRPVEDGTGDIENRQKNPRNPTVTKFRAGLKVECKPDRHCGGRKILKPRIPGGKTGSGEKVF